MIAAAAVGCGVGTPEVTSDAAQSPASDVAAPSPTPTDVPTPTATSAAASSPEPAETETTPPQEDDGLPAQAPAEHGGQAVALYLAVTDQGYDSAPVQQAQSVATELGYETGVADLGCDRGAAEALGYPTGSGQAWAAVALYFASVEEAEQVRAAAQEAGHPVEGVAEVTTYCLD